MPKIKGSYGYKNNSERTEFIKFRVSKENKDLFNKAARLEGENLSDFIHHAIQRYITSGSYKLIGISQKERDSIINSYSKFTGSLYKKDLKRKRILNRPL